MDDGYMYAWVAWNISMNTSICMENWLMLLCLVTYVWNYYVRRCLVMRFVLLNFIKLPLSWSSLLLASFQYPSKKKTWSTGMMWQKGEIQSSRYFSHATTTYLNVMKCLFCSRDYNNPASKIIIMLMAKGLFSEYECIHLKALAYNYSLVIYNLKSMNKTNDYCYVGEFKTCWLHSSWRHVCTLFVL